MDKSWYHIHGLSGKTVSWIPSDSEERYKQNLLRRPDLLKKYGWDEHSVSYTFNKEGFRADEFTGGVGDSVVFLGCSLTVGVGMPLEDTWAYKVASILGLRRYNLGIGAGSNDTCFRMAYYWIPRLRPKYVVMLSPSENRIELITDEEQFLFVPSMYYDRFDGFYQEWIGHPANAQMNRIKNVMGVQTVCNSIGVPLLEIPVDDFLFNVQPIGRDLMHPGREWNDMVASAVLEKMQVVA